MKLRLFNVMAGASLVFCLAMVAIWIRGYFYVDHYVFQSPRVGPLFYPNAANATCRSIRQQTLRRDIPFSAKASDSAAVTAYRHLFGRMLWGFGFYHAPNQLGGVVTAVLVPFWAVVIGLAILPASEGSRGSCRSAMAGGMLSDVWVRSAGDAGAVSGVWEGSAEKEIISS